MAFPLRPEYRAGIVIGTGNPGSPRERVVHLQRRSADVKKTCDTRSRKVKLQQSLKRFLLEASRHGQPFFTGTCADDGGI